MRTAAPEDGDPAADYVARVHRAVDYVVGNLNGDLRLEAVAKAACFSPFHFHRVFKSLLGETLAHFVKRQRLERALRLMAHAPSRSLTEIALECGFASSSDFSRAFKQAHGTPPSRFDLVAYREARRAEFAQSQGDGDGVRRYARLPAGANPDGFTVTLRDLPPRTVAYVRVLDPYRSFAAVVAAYEHLMRWATKAGVADRPWLGYMWDDPELVPLAKCRYDAAVEVDDVRPRGRIGRYQFPAMRVAEVRIAGGLELETRACDWLMETWLPRSGYVPADLPAFEAWIGRPFAHGPSHFTIACQLPVERA